MHLLADISAHGLGHLSQTAPVLNALRAAHPHIRLTVRSALPHERLAARIRGAFEHVAEASDFGFVMHNAVDIDFAASAERYREFHAAWDERVAAAARDLSARGVDFVLANVAYLPLAAAGAAGISALGMCSLNWVDLFRHYFAAEPWFAPIADKMLAAYNAADRFLRITPGMPMPDFSRAIDIGPVAILASATRDVVRRRIAADQGWDIAKRWVLLAMGGMEFRLPVDDWPPSSETLWLCPAAWQVSRDDAASFDAAVAAHGFTDLLAASDAVVTKPGYGTFSEAACNGTPVLYVPRDDWPEEAPLAAWLTRHTRARVVAREDLLAGRIGAALDTLLAATVPPRPAPIGIAQAVAAIETVAAGRLSAPPLRVPPVC